MSQLSMSNRYPLSGQIRDNVRLSTRVMERGMDHVVSFPGTSQFTALGVSACGLAAFNFARIAFRIEQNNGTISDVLDQLGTRKIIEEIVAICAGWSSDAHLEVDDLYDLPIFSGSLELAATRYGRPQPKFFTYLLKQLKKTEKSSVIIITRPPEIIACFKFVNSNANRSSPVFVVFDSHTRPTHPQGAGLSFSTSIESTARTLNDILPTMDESMFNSSDFQWQAQLFSNCSAHVYVGRPQTQDHETAIIQSSLSILELRAHISELNRENEKLETDNKQLDSEADRLRAFIRQEQAKTHSESWVGLANRVLGRSFGLISHAVAGPSGTSSAYGNRSVDSPTYTPAKQHARPVHRPPKSTIVVGASGAQSIFAHNPPPVPSTMPSGYEEIDFGNDPSPDGVGDNDGDDFALDDQWIDSADLARQLQDEFDSEDLRLRQERASIAHQRQHRQPQNTDFNSPQDRQARGRREHNNRYTPLYQDNFDNEDWPELRREHPRYTQQLQNRFDDEDRRVRQERARHAQQLQNKFDEEDRRLRQEHTRLALRLQNEFDAEDRRLRREQAELVTYVQATFQCSICLDELPEDDVAKVDDCVHTMCRICLREFVSSKIQEHRYPIFCPMCTVDADRKTDPGVISRSLIEQLGVSEGQSQILTEMELAEFTIQIHCRQCQRPAFVDREDYAEVFNIVCPQDDCYHVWCKKCEQTIVVDGPKHSCDGSNELDHLMKEKGWKHCPNCTTPIQKETGCNHMTCISPGCNTHFCYICGNMIVRSALNNEIDQAVSAHFRKCLLFEVPN